ncbi:MAG: IS200/IS605 family transposase [Pirellulaceae bacterium]|nr:IS200/IS605 family transposase [Pirellulaceae bacterium]
MRIEPFTSDQLALAWCHRVYLRFRTYSRREVEALNALKQQTFSELLTPFDIRILELSTDAINVRLLASLNTKDAVSSAASKIKGRLSKWLTEFSSVDPNEGPQKWLGRGYFAVTTGNSTEHEVSAYLERQAVHHGYDRRALSPVFVRTFELHDDDERQLATDHATTRLRYHVVLATQGRQGVFTKDAGAAVTEAWRGMQPEMKAAIQKVSFVPDHVHVALALHPTVSPVALVTQLMNCAQDLIWKQFEGNAIRAGISRLWQPSAYVGSFGDLRSTAISSYVKRWERSGG